jgi:hypothetical protein
MSPQSCPPFSIFVTHDRRGRGRGGGPKLSLLTCRRRTRPHRGIRRSLTHRKYPNQRRGKDIYRCGPLVDWKTREAVALFQESRGSLPFHYVSPLSGSRLQRKHRGCASNPPIGCVSTASRSIRTRLHFRFLVLPAPALLPPEGAPDGLLCASLSPPSLPRCVSFLERSFSLILP